MTGAPEPGAPGALAAGARSVLRVVYLALARSPVAPLLRSPTIERARRRVTETHVSADDVPHIVSLLDAAGVKAWLAGGWACDALLGEQTRPHGDLDLIIAEAHRQPACDVLAADGFAVAEVFEAGLMSTAVELVDRRHRRTVALHPVDVGGAWSESLRRVMHDLELDGGEIFTTGTVAARHLPCLSAPALVALHTGYQPTDGDRRDVCVLCARFSLPIPPGYECPNDDGD